MFKSIGFIISLWALSHFFTSFTSFDDAMVETFKTVELAAVVSQEKIEGVR